MSQTAKRLAELGVVLPKAAAPVANYVPFVRTSGMAPGALPLLFVSGQLPLGPDGKLDDRHKGKLGPDSPIDTAREAAERCAINILAQAHEALGDLDKIVRVIRLGGFFNVASSFE
ncbi:MAG: RidA family protein, partial [Beijerinckiaceae bacterium]